MSAKATKAAQPAAIDVQQDENEPLSAKAAATMRLSIFEGSFTIVFLNWISGSVITGYMQYHNASTLELALVSSIPALAQASAPVAAWIQSFYPHPKKLTILLAAIGRVMWLLPALWPFFSLPADAIPTYTIILMVASFFFLQACGAVWTAWMGGVVPRRMRGSYFGRRTAILGMVGLVANLLAGVFLDHVGAPHNYQVIFFVGVICALVATNMFRFHWQPPVVAAPIRLHEVIRKPFRDPNMRRLLVFVAYWQASVLLGATFVYPYFQKGHLHMTFTQIGIYQAIAATCSLILGPVWGRVADRFGNKSVLSITTFIAGSFLPLSWIIIIPGRPGLLYVNAIIDAIAWSAINPAIFNLSLATAPSKDRIAYISVISMCTGLSGFAGGLLSAPLLEAFKATHCMIGGFEWTQYHTLFAVSACLRSSAWIFLKRVHETRAWRTRDLIMAALPRLPNFFWWR
ncbi:MFS transporter [Candidatus Sumerlaeota bacterium]|nr:MFS transporter [Candidatus Sumerlaeota bacterium]